MNSTVLLGLTGILWVIFIYTCAIPVVVYVTELIRHRG